MPGARFRRICWIFFFFLFLSLSIIAVPDLPLSDTWFLGPPPCSMSRGRSCLFLQCFFNIPPLYFNCFFFLPPICFIHFKSPAPRIGLSRTCLVFLSAVIWRLRKSLDKVILAPWLVFPLLPQSSSLFLHPGLLSFPGTVLILVWSCLASPHLQTFFHSAKAMNGNTRLNTISPFFLFPLLFCTAERLPSL